MSPDPVILQAGVDESEAKQQEGTPEIFDLSSLTFSLPGSMASCGDRERGTWGQVGMGGCWRVGFTSRRAWGTCVAHM